MARTGFNIYVVNRIAYVPTERVTRHGVRMGSEPVSAAQVQDILRLKETVLQALRLGTPEVASEHDLVPAMASILRLAQFRSWKAFARKAACWRLDEVAGGYKFRLMEPDRGGWSSGDPSKMEVLPIDTPFEILAERIAKRISGAESSE